MQNRIVSFSTALMAASISFTAPRGTSEAQAAEGFLTDPATGIVYRPEIRTIETPVVDTQIRKEERVLYRPQTVTDVKNEARTTYTPVVEYKWEPRLYGRWNPFVQPTVAYHHVPVSRWEARSDLVPRTTTRTEWVAEKQIIEIPTRVVRIERSSKTDYVAVGKVAPTAPPQQPAASDQIASHLQIASRLRPLDTSISIQPFSGLQQLQANSQTRFANDPRQRSLDQSGMRPIELHPNASNNQLMPPSNRSGVAGFASPPFWR